MRKLNVRRLLSSIWWVSIGLMLACACAVGWAVIEFGSVRTARAYVQGYALVPDAFAKDLGPIRAGQKTPVHFRLRNVSSGPVRLLGARTTCTCMLMSDLPMLIEPSGDAVFRVNVRPGPGNVAKPFTHTVELYLDAPSVPIILTISATVAPGNQEKRTSVF